MDASFLSSSSFCATGANTSQEVLLHCPRCGSPGTRERKHVEFPEWAVTVSCSNAAICGFDWSLCRLCLPAGGHDFKTFTNQRQLSYHARKHRTNCDDDDRHRKIQKFSSEVSIEDFANEADTEDFGNEADIVCQEIGEIGSRVIVPFVKPVFDFPRNQSSLYFKHQHDDKGLAFLVSLSQFHIAAIDLVGDDEKELHLSIALFAASLSRLQRDKFAKILGLVTDFNNKKMFYELRNMAGGPRTQIPTTPKVMRSSIITGKYSFLENLPHPAVSMVEGHAYVSLKDCIKDFLARGGEVGTISEKSKPVVRTLGESEMAVKIRDKMTKDDEQPSLCIWLMEWSDDFDPNRSTKANRASVWLKIVTIAYPHSKRGSFRYTYPIAIGKKKLDHEPVEAKFKEELLDLGSKDGHMMYYKKVGGMVRVKAFLLASLQDQPERRGANYLTMGNGSYSARWGYAADWAVVSSRLPSCHSCASKLKNGEAVTACSSCTNWCAESENGLLDYDPPKGYPRERLNENRKLSPSVTTYKTLKKAVEDAHGNFVSGRWKVKQFETFLKSSRSPSSNS